MTVELQRQGAEVSLSFDLLINLVVYMIKVLAVDTLISTHLVGVEALFRLNCD